MFFTCYETSGLATSVLVVRVGVSNCSVDGENIPALGESGIDQRRRAFASRLPMSWRPGREGHWERGKVVNSREGRGIRGTEVGKDKGRRVKR